MSTIQIPALPSAPSAGGTDLLLLRQGSVDKKVSREVFLDGIDNDDLSGLIQSTGSNSAYILTTGDNINTLSIPMAWVWRSNHSNTGPCTLQIDTSGAVPMVDLEGNNFIAGDMDASGVYFAVYDGTNFVAINAPWSATEAKKGMIEKATVAECDAGIDTERAVTPEGLLSSILANAPAPLSATTILEGIVELATNLEAQTGSDTTRAITPSALASVTATTTRAGLVEKATASEASVGSDTQRYITPEHLLTSHDDAIVQALSQAPIASTILRGKVELATNAEVQAGSDTERAVTPVALASLTANETRSGLAEIATQVEIDAGGDDERYATPLKMKNWVRDATEVVKGFVQRASQAEADAQTNTEKYITPAHLASLGVTGQIIMMGSTVVPTAHLECDGAEVSRTTYANLYSAVGNTWGNGNGTTTFNLPDLRGEFLRGWDHGKGVDSGRVVGVSQEDEMKSHNHPLVGNNRGTNTNQLFAAGLYQDDAELVASDPASIGETGGVETRPRNHAIMYCIRT